MNAINAIIDRAIVKSCIQLQTTLCSVSSFFLISGVYVYAYNMHICMDTYMYI